MSTPTSPPPDAAADVAAGLAAGALPAPTASPLPDHPAEPGGQPHEGAELLIVTGMSGAGRSTAAHGLEDLGWYVVDNLPPQMLAPLSLLAARAAETVPRVAVVVDVRGRGFSTDLAEALHGLDEHGIRRRVLFLEASDAALVRRFESVRRPHPLQGDGGILDGITSERTVLLDVKASADVVIDTSDLNVHQLSAVVTDVFGTDDRTGLRLTVTSFGFKYGLPTDADHVVDVRFLPNPHWVPSLRPLTGRDEPVAEYVLGQPGAEEFVERYAAALEPVLAGYRRENRRYATVAVGCTGGKHRSVAIAHALVARLESMPAVAEAGTTLRTTHRDLGRE